MQELMGGYLERSVQVFMNQQKVLQDQIQQAMGMTPLGSMQNLAQKNMDVWTQLQKSFLDALVPRNEPAGSGTAESSPGKGDDPAKE
jgi:polyhydroxyalkanoate synthesis regulator protein